MEEQSENSRQQGKRQKNDLAGRGVGCIFYIVDEKKLMFYRRDNKPTIPFPDHVSLLGGHMDPGETPRQTMMRELAEELIMNDTKQPFQPTGVTHFETYVDERNVQQNIFTCTLPTKPNLTLLEGQKLVYLTPDEARQTDFAFGFNRVISSCIQRKHCNPAN